MPQVFHPSMNTISRVSIFGAVFILAAVGALLYVFVRSPYVTEAGVVRVQPVPFSHKHHIGDDGIDCRYCHISVEDSSFAGIPSTKICMNCHSQLWADSPMLQPVRESYETGQPLQWTRVHDLPDYVYFDHSIHIHKGISCVRCHGQVDEMPLMWREHTLLMEWCLDCHRRPEENLRPREEVFNMDWQAASGDEEAEKFDPRQLAIDYHVQSKMNCTTCHR